MGSSLAGGQGYSSSFESSRQWDYWFLHLNMLGAGWPLREQKQSHEGTFINLACSGHGDNTLRAPDLHASGLGWKLLTLSIQDAFLSEYVGLKHVKMVLYSLEYKNKIVVRIWTILKVVLLHRWVGLQEDSQGALGSQTETAVIPPRIF